MGIQYASIVDHRLDRVWDWHTRPGAMRRLVPPWQPMRVVKETQSLAYGRAILGLPGGLRWIARHDPAGYDPPHQFLDVLSSDYGLGSIMTLPPRLIGWWRHTHRFSDAGNGTTRVHDIVDTTVPGFTLRSTFAYRHRQLAEDLDAHADAAAALADARLTVAVTGSTGLVGTALCAFLSTGGHRVIRLVRGTPGNDSERHWNPQQPSVALLEGVDAVVHLAGEPIVGRFTDAHRRAIRDSRVEPTSRLAAVAAATPGIRAFVSASAIGYYGFACGDAELDEDSPRGDGFLADVVAAWEAATAPAAEAGLRVVNVRTGIVQAAAAGGTLRLLRPLVAAGLGGLLGTGRQWLSWIGIDDLLDVYYRAVYDTGLSGPVNAVGPVPVQYSEYTAALAAALRRPGMLPVPSAGPSLLPGRQGAVQMAEAGQRAMPAKLLQRGHRFRHRTVQDALAHQLGNDPAPGVL